MRAPLRIEQHKIKEVASLLIPLHKMQLLVPNVSVAEIVPVTQVSAASDAPNWYLGSCQWREQRVPLISLEVLNGEAKPGLHNRARIAVLNSTGISDDLPFFAVITQGLPRLARVTEEEISAHENTEDMKPFDLMHVSWAGEEAIIPDLARIEQAILNYRRSLDQ